MVIQRKASEQRFFTVQLYIFSLWRLKNFAIGGWWGGVAASAERSRATGFSASRNVFHPQLYLRLDSQGYLNQSTEMSFIILASQRHLSM